MGGAREYRAHLSMKVEHVESAISDRSTWTGELVEIEDYLDRVNPEWWSKVRSVYGSWTSSRLDLAAVVMGIANICTSYMKKHKIKQTGDSKYPIELVHAVANLRGI